MTTSCRIPDCKPKVAKVHTVGMTKVAETPVSPRYFGSRFGGKFSHPERGACRAVVMSIGIPGMPMPMLPIPVFRMLPIVS